MSDAIRVNIYSISDKMELMTDIERQRMLSLVSLDRRKKVLRKKARIADYSLIAGYLLENDIKGYIKDVFEREIDVLDIEEGENGKPYLASEDYKGIFFNLSHSGDYVMTAVGSSVVGIDIERCGKCNKRIAERFFSESDNAFIDGISDEEIESKMGCNSRDELYTAFWTMKEAYLKWKGTGIADGLASFDIDYANMGVIGENVRFMTSFTADRRYTYTVCVEGGVEVIVG